MEIQEQIIRQIRSNRISTTEIADCQNKTGLFPNCFPLNRGHHRAGRVFWAYAYNESNWEVHEQVRRVGEGDVLVLEAFDCGSRAVFGELVSKYVLLYRQASAIVTDGYMRDIPPLVKENWPVWCRGGTPIGCFNRRNEVPLDEDLITERRARYEGAIAVCDDSGVVIIPRAVQDEEFLKKLDWIEEQEDIWFDCLDRRKWDTYKIVCEKAYLQDGH